MQAIVDQLLTSYRIEGSGKNTILFLHGWADSEKTFDGLVRELKLANADFKYILLDLPGFGGTQPPPQPWGLDDYADFVRKFLDKTGQNTDTILGHSNGGAIAIKGLSEGKLKASKLVLVASAGIRDPSLKKTAIRLLAKPAKIAIKAAPLSTQRRIRQKLYNAIGSDYLVAEHMQETFKRIVTSDVRDSAQKLSLPACLIYGQEDNATPPEFGKLLADSLKNSVYNEIPQTGHFVHQEQAYKTAAIIKDFIEK